MVILKYIWTNNVGVETFNATSGLNSNNWPGRRGVKFIVPSNAFTNRTVQKRLKDVKNKKVCTVHRGRY